MNRIPLIFAALLAGLMMAGTYAVAAEENAEGIIEERIRTLAPNAKTIAISETPIDGILQVQINSDIVYVTADGQYLLQGQIMDIDTRTNITDQAKSGIRVGLLSDLKADEQITFTPVKPKYDVLVFTDIDCGYCRKLHNQMDGYNEEGIAIHYLAFPRAGVGSASYDKFVSVWCADDQKTALTLAKNGTDPEPEKCPNPIADQYELGREIGVTGTPALVTTDGTLIPGYMPPAQLRQRLESLNAPVAGK
jgi:thiol:disulfide interchange protein DsbC